MGTRILIGLIVGTGAICLLYINNKLNKIIMSNERINAAIARMGTAVEGVATSQVNIAEDIRRIKDEITGGGNLEEIAVKLEEQATKLEQSAASLRALDLENEPAAEEPPPQG